MTRALYRRASSVRAFRFDGDVGTSSRFFSHLADCSSCPSAFAPDRSLSVGCLPETDLERGRWHLFGPDGGLVGRLDDAEMLATYEDISPGRYAMRLGRVEQIGVRRGAFVGTDGAVSDPFGALRGALRLDAGGRPLCPADDPLCLQMAALLRAADPEFHLAHLKLLCVLASDDARLPAAKADAAAAMDAEEWPEMTRAAASLDLAEAAAAISARIALEATVPGLGFPEESSKPH